MVRAGETGGYLRSALERLVEMREKREALITQVRAALTYPITLSSRNAAECRQGGLSWSFAAETV